VKRDGEWIRPLKFLGLEYDGKRDKLRARTRGGSTLEYDKGGDMVKAVNAIEKAVTKKERGMGVQPPPRIGHSANPRKLTEPNRKPYCRVNTISTVFR
jgi:predicted Zn-ribbon and HTH transcriptional regulator